MQQIVLVGAGQASAWAAYTLRSNGYKEKISVVSREKMAFYERPPLTKEYLAGEKSADSLSLFPQDIIANLDLEWYLNDEVIDIDISNKTAILASGQMIPYDYLLLATGSEAKIPVTEWENLSNVYTLKTLEDSNRLKEQLKPDRNLALIGGGWIGLEIAATANLKKLHVSIFELAPRLCQRTTSIEISNYLKEIHEAHHNKLFFNIKSIQLIEKNNKIDIYHNENLIMSADLAVIGAGAKLNIELAQKINLDIQNGAIKVDHNCKTSNEFIYAAGDVAIHPDYGFSLQSYQHAQKQGIVAAKSMLGLQACYNDIPWSWSDQFENNIQLLGVVSNEEVKCIERMINQHQKTYFYFNRNHQLKAVYAVNEPKAVKLARKWILNQIDIPIEKIKDPEFNLMDIKI